MKRARLVEHTKGYAGENWEFELLDVFLPHTEGAFGIKHVIVSIGYGIMGPVRADITIPGGFLPKIDPSPLDSRTILTTRYIDHWGQGGPGSVLALIGYEVVEDEA